MFFIGDFRGLGKWRDEDAEYQLGFNSIPAEMVHKESCCAPFSVKYAQDLWLLQDSCEAQLPFGVTLPNLPVLK